MVGQCFEQDCVVIVVVGFEMGYVWVDVDFGGDGEGVDLVLFVVVGWCDEIGQVEVWLFYWFVYLLVQEVQYCWFVVGGQVYVVVDVVGWLKFEYGFGGQLFFVDDVVQYCVGIVVEFVGLGVDDFVGEDCWEFVCQFLGLEEWCLVDYFDQVGEWVVVEYVQVGLVWGRWYVGCLVVVEVLCMCFGQGYQLFGVVVVVMVLVDVGVVGFVGGYEGVVQFVGDQ